MNPALLALLGARAAASTGLVVTVTDTKSGTASTTTLSETVNIGAPSASRSVVVVLATSHTLARYLNGTALNINGANAAVVGNQNRAGAVIAMASVPTGDTATIGGVWNSSGADWEMVVYTVDAALSTVDTATAISDGVTASLTDTLTPTASGDLVFVGVGWHEGTVTLADATVDVSQANRKIGRATASSTSHVVAVSLSAPGTATYARMAAAAFRAA